MPESSVPENPTQLPSATMVFPSPLVQQSEEARRNTIWHIHVEVLGGPMDGLRKRVARPRFTMGRGVGNDLQLPLDPMVSGNHAHILREGEHFWLEDLGSRNGVFLGDRRLTERVLIGRGTIFRIGQTELEFLPRLLTLGS